MFPPVLLVDLACACCAFPPVKAAMALLVLCCLLAALLALFCALPCRTPPKPCAPIPIAVSPVFDPRAPKSLERSNPPLSGDDSVMGVPLN